MKTPEDRKFRQCGTSTFMGPDYFNKTSGYGMEVDIWALGITLYELKGGSFSDVIFTVNSGDFK